MIMDLLERRATTTAETVTMVATFNPATGKQTTTESYIDVGNCIFFEGGSSKSLFSDAMREQVTATACFKPDVIISGNKMRINGKKIYAIVGQEDVANQGQVLKVYLGEIS